MNAELKQSVLDALKAGFRHIDLAEGYNNTESFGAALAEANISRDQLFITDKLAAGIKDVRGTLTASLKSPLNPCAALADREQKRASTTSTCF